MVKTTKHTICKRNIFLFSGDGEALNIIELKNLLAIQVKSHGDNST